MNCDMGILKGISAADVDHDAVLTFRYENRAFHAPLERLTVLEIKRIVGQETEVALAEIVDGRQVERPNHHVVDLSRGCSFKRVPEFVRG